MNEIQIAAEKLKGLREFIGVDTEIITLKRDGVKSVIEEIDATLACLAKAEIRERV